VVVGLASRIYRITSPEFRASQLAFLRTKLSNRGYPDMVISRGFQKARAEHFKKIHPQVLKCTRKVQDIQLILDLDNKDHVAVPIARGLFKNFVESKGLDWRMQVAYRRDQNILELVTKGRKCLNRNNLKRFDLRACEKCSFCANLEVPLSIPSPGGYHYKLPQKNMSCISEAVIYKITCGCQKSYIGRTARTIKERFKEHWNGIKKYESEMRRPKRKDKNAKKDKNESEFGGKTRKRFYRHMATCNKREDWKWCLLEKVQNSNRFTLEAAERRFLKMFKPALNTQLAF